MLEQWGEADLGRSPPVLLNNSLQVNPGAVRSQCERTRSRRAARTAFVCGQRTLMLYYGIKGIDHFAHFWSWPIIQSHSSCNYLQRSLVQWKRAPSDHPGVMAPYETVQIYTPVSSAANVIAEL